jgi:hypothetical protein
MRYSPHPPYEVLQTKLIDFATMQRLRRFAKYWDLVANSGNFIETTPLIWSESRSSRRHKAHSNTRSEKRKADVSQRLLTSAATENMPSPFAAFLGFSDWLYARVGRTDSIALARLAELLFTFLTEELGGDPQLVAETLWRDWRRGGRRERPEFLRAFLPNAERTSDDRSTTAAPKRQARHLAREK